jgi:hypothetical protein
MTFEEQFTKKNLNEQTYGRAPVRTLAPGHGIEHEAAQREVKFKRGLAPNLRDYGHDPIERSRPPDFALSFVWGGLWVLLTGSKDMEG